MHSSFSNDNFILETVNGVCQLRKADDLKMKPVFVDFCSGKNEYRRKLGGGKSQHIARAVGCKKQPYPSVVDATAGLGRDAFVLASIGCRVHMIERSKIISSLLEDGLRRASQDNEIGLWIKERMSFSSGNFVEQLTNLPFSPDAVYLDPMFGSQPSSALVKKEMRILHELLGSDDDADQLLEASLSVARNRVVVKRASKSPYLADKTPNVSIETKSNRFDLYLTA